MTPRSIEVTEELIREIEESSLLVFTGAAHVSGSIHDDIRSSYHEPSSKTLEAMFELRGEAERMAQALEAGDLEGYARALGGSCRGLYNLHESCDSAEHRAVFDRLEELILAGKTCGAGGGGFLLLCGKPGRREECAAAVAELGAESWPFEFDFEGVSVTEETAWTEEEVGATVGGSPERLRAERRPFPGAPARTSSFSRRFRPRPAEQNDLSPVRLRASGPCRAISRCR